MKRSSGSRVVESSRSLQSRGESHATAGSRNNESSLYANDTFATEDNEGGYSDSQNTLSQTSSISLPFSGRDSADVPPRQISNLSEKSVSRASLVKRNNSNESVKSTKSTSHKESKSKSESYKSSQQQSKTSTMSSKLKRQDNVVSYESDKSEKSEKLNSYYTNESSNLDESKSRSQVFSQTDKPDPNLGDSGEADYFKTQQQSQLKTTDSVDKNISSLLSSVGLERYMGAEDSVDASEKNTLDVDSRPATHASVNTLTEDSIVSPKHVSYSNYSPDKGEYVSDVPFSPDPDSHRNLDHSPNQVDLAVGFKPNTSALSPRKSKNTSTSFQVTKRQHGMAKLDERPESQMSGDTTLREIDMMLENESFMTSGSSLMLTTDEAISPMGSMNMGLKYKQHLNQSGHGFNKFRKRQVDFIQCLV